MSFGALQAAPGKYLDELRERAVRLVAESGRPIAHVARDLGVHHEALRTGYVRPKPTAVSVPNGATTAEQQELAALRKEVAELRRANEILKAASVYFAKELDQPRTRPTR